MKMLVLSLGFVLLAVPPALARGGHSPILAAAVGGFAVAGVAEKAIFEDPPAWQGPPAGDGIPGTGNGRVVLADRAAAEACAAAGVQALVAGLQQTGPAVAQSAAGRTQFVLSAPSDRPALAHESDGKPVTCRGNAFLAKP